MRFLLCFESRNEKSRKPFQVPGSQIRAFALTSLGAGWGGIEGHGARLLADGRVTDEIGPLAQIR